MALSSEGDFSVARCAKASAFGFELATDFAKVVHLAVEHDRHVARFVPHRLIGIRREVQDTKPAVAESRAAVLRNPEAVRASVEERLGHLLQDRPVGGLGAEREGPGNSAHAVQPSSIATECSLRSLVVPASTEARL